MANENWRPGSGKALPTNTPIKVDPRFSTITDDNPSGYVPYYPGETGKNNPFYAINSEGVVTHKFGPGPSTEFLQGDVENTLNDFAARTVGENGNKIISRTGFQSILQSQLETRAPQLGIRPTQTQTAPPQRNPDGSQRRSETDPGATPDPDLAAAPSAETLELDFLQDMGKEFADPEEGKKYAKWNLKYPSTIESGQDRIIISQLKYVSSLNVNADGGESTFNSGVRDTEDGIKANLIGSVILPMPNDLSESNSVGWGEDSLSNFAAMVMPGLIQAGAGLAEVDFGKSGAGIGKLIEALKNDGLGKRAYQYLATNAGASLLKKANINVNPEAYITRATGAAINPNLELLFNGPKLRQFTLAFKMTPRSESEARSIRGILQFFKKGMSPRRSAKEANSFFLGTPNVFKIKFMGPKGELKSIGKFKTCALVSFSASYTPDGFYAAFSDPSVGSQPISVTMQMGFTELTPVYSDEYDLSDDDVNIGPSVFTNKYDSKVSGSSEPQVARGPVQGPTPSGRTLDEQRRIDEVIRQAGSTTPNIPGSAL